MGSGKFTFPQITIAQVLAVLGWVAAQAVAYGVIDARTAQLVLSAGATILAAAWKLADALIHNANAKVAAAQIVATGNPSAPTAGSRRAPH